MKDRNLKRRKLDSGHYAYYHGKTLVGLVKFTTKDTSMISALSGRPGPKRWYPTDANGIALVPGFQCSTLSEAKKWLDQITAEPSAELTRNPRSGLVSGSLYYRGHVFWVSRWPKEKYWVVDGHIPVGAFCPSFAHGTGSRCGDVNRNTLKPGEWTAPLDKEHKRLMAELKA
jgi:hypothetical protein